MTSIINGRLILPDDEGNFKICAGKVLNFDEKIFSISDSIDGEIFDAENDFVAPGFINVHIHGCAGADTMDDDSAALTTMREFLPSAGVTSFLPTTMTMSLEKISGALERIRHAKKISSCQSGTARRLTKLHGRRLSAEPNTSRIFSTRKVPCTTENPALSGRLSIRTRWLKLSPTMFTFTPSLNGLQKKLSRAVKSF